MALLVASATVKKFRENLMTRIKSCQEKDALANNIQTQIKSASDISHLQYGTSLSTWSTIDGALAYEGRIYIPKDDELRSHIISLFHDPPESGHFGTLRTMEIISCDFYWSGMEGTVKRYVMACEVCNRSKAPRHKHYGMNIAITPPEYPWQGVTMDFVTDLPESIACKYDSILVVVDRLTKIALYNHMPTLSRHHAKHTKSRRFLGHIN